MAVEVISSNNQNTYQIIGGYNPQSWDSSNNYHYTNNDADRTGFIFNLTNANVGKMHQKKTTESGYYYKGSDYGPH